MEDDDDFKGTCSQMRRSSESPSSSSSSSSAAPQNNLKTTGLQESDWYKCQEHEASVEEDGVKAMMQYLPHSAALLVTALQQSGVKGKKPKKSGDDLYYHDESDDEETAVAGIRLGISQITTNKDGEIIKSPPRPSLTLPITLTTPQMENNERIADMLLESIIQMDDNFVGCSFRGSTRKKTGNVAWIARREGLRVAEGSDDIAVANDSGDNDVTQ